jgi:foldase protein PrsA
MLNKLYANYILKDMKFTEEELQKYYEQNRNEFLIPEKRRIAHILIDLQYTAKEVIKKLKEGESFEDLAKSYSKDLETAKRGGEVGWIGKGEVLPPIEKAAFSLNSGEVSDLVQTDLGYHIIKLLEIRPAQPMDFSQAKKEIEKKVLKKKRDEKIAHWINQLKPVSKIEINEEGIKTAVKELEKGFEKKSGEQ